ncbi:MAG: DNA polymerase III subunit epsilon [Firmicutes bacterium]|nr:DNA polymerase III subunit epsilon [Bacillota bacterium]
MLVDRFVAIDLETTGGDPEADRILEIGAVLFEEGEPVLARSWLTDPGRPIPLRFQQLTGITPEMVAGKPPAEAVLPELLALIQGVPIFAHNAAFDAAFLAAACRRAGLEPPGPVLDSLELAKIAFPRARSYRLGALARELGIPLVSAHRAEDDARAAGYVVARALAKLGAMETDALLEMLRLAPGDWPLRPLVEAAADRRLKAGARPRPKAAWIPPHPVPLHGGEEPPPPEPIRPVDPAEVAAILGPGGAIAQAHPGYEHREGQLEMALRVTQALNAGRHLLLEAGTGTGKSLAYLVPAFLWARANRRRVVIATHTITLQEQLWEREIPFLLRALGWEKEVRVALAKGRNNYLCLRRWEEAVAGADFGTAVEERSFLIRTLAWLQETETGDRGELQLSGSQEEYWRQVMSEAETCLGPRCQWFQRHCFAFRARKRAREAEILVVNHALLLADLRAGGGVLPPFDHLIIDEAHHLEAVATEHLGLSLSGWELLGALGRLFRGWGGPQGPGLLPHLRRKLRRPVPSRPPLGTPEDDLLEQVTDLVRGARERVTELMAALAALTAEMGEGGDGEGGHTLRITAPVRQSLAWEAVEVARQNATGALRRLAEALALLGQALEELDEPRPGDLESTLLELAREAGWIYQAAQDIDEVLLGEDEAYVRWVEVGPPRRGGEVPVTLRSAPVSVAELLRAQLFDRLRTVILTSATLTVGGSFDHVRRSLGLADLGPDRLETGVVPSPFRYREQALVLIPTDVPSPREPEAEYTEAAARFVQELAVAVGGRTLVLFTSHRMMRQVYNRVKEPLEAAGLVLLAQGLDGHRARLVEEFRAGHRAILFGAASFWEGVDIPGEDLSCVVLIRLPFLPPDEPVTAARTEALERQGLSAFFHLSLPQAVIRFKQGFGRLIRTRQDRGVVIVFDSRVDPRRTRYGARFLQSLPDPRVVAAPQAEVIRLAAEFLAMPTSQGGEEVCASS